MHCRSAVLLAVSSILCSSQAHCLAAFPGAQGFGAETPGGRGGAVLFVENLHDSGPGSLRAAIETPGPRIVLFRVSGAITLRSPLLIDEPFITIAGHTAPGGGIQLRNNPEGLDDARAGLASDSFNSIEIDTHDVVIRHLRVRPGPLDENPLCTGPSPPEVPPPPSAPSTANTCVDANDIRAIAILDNAKNVYIDHASLSWASDEIISFEGATDVTVAWSIISEGMNYVLYGGHFRPVPGFSGKGVITGNTTIAADGVITGRVSLHHNAWAHNSARSPQITTNCIDVAAPMTCAADVVNNVTYNWWKFGILSGNILGHHFGNVVNNFVRAGPSSGNVDHGLRLVDYSELSVVPNATVGVHYAGNRKFFADGQSEDMPIFCRVWNDAGGVFDPCDVTTYSQPERYAAPGVDTTSAEAALTDVLADAGANRRLEADGTMSFSRDANDQRVLDDIDAGTGELIDSIAEFPGWPALAVGTAPTDSDDDGMPDTWELMHGFDHRLAADAGADADRDGYTDIEEYLNGTDPLDPPAIPAFGPAARIAAAMSILASGALCLRRAAAWR